MSDKKILGKNLGSLTEVQVPVGQLVEGQLLVDARLLTEGSDEANDKVLAMEDDTGGPKKRNATAPSSERNPIVKAGYDYPMGAACHAARKDSSSYKSIWNSARKRFELFLWWLLKEKLPPAAYAQIIAQRDKIAQRLFQAPAANSLPNNDIIWDKLSPENIQIQEVDLFASWLFKHGKRLDKSNKRIEYKTAEGDISSLVNHIRNLECKRPGEGFPKDKMKSIREGMQRMFTRRVKQQNRPLV